MLQLSSTPIHPMKVHEDKKIYILDFVHAVVYLAVGKKYLKNIVYTSIQEFQDTYIKVIYVFDESAAIIEKCQP